MEKEIEAKFLNVNHEDFRKVLLSHGAVKTSELYEQKREIYKTQPDPSTKDDYFWFRLRDENQKNTLTYKHITGKGIDDVEEIEIQVDDFAKTGMLLEKAGLLKTSLQNNKREVWELDGCEIMLDEWPHIPSFIEIESASEERVRALAGKLGFEWNSAVFGSVDTAYEHHFDIDNGYTITGLPVLNFETPLSEDLEKKRK